jgi:SlyX protein
MARELEERIAHLERMVEELSDVVVTQGRELDRMGRVVEALRQKAVQDSQAQDGGIVMADERPPHY